MPTDQLAATDPLKGFVLRSGPGRLNPFDGPALEMALRLKDNSGCQVDLFSMGPPKAELTLKEALSLGADLAYLLSDPRLAGSDSLATARALASALTLKGPYDLVVCGLTTTDGGTGQVPPALAALLGWPLAGRIDRVSGLESGGLAVSQLYQDERIEALLPLPAVASVLRESFTPRLPTVRAKLRPKTVTWLTAEDLLSAGDPPFNQGGPAGSGPGDSVPGRKKTLSTQLSPEGAQAAHPSGAGPDGQRLFGESGSPTKILRTRRPKPPDRIVARPTASEAVAVILEAVRAAKP